VLLDGEIFSSLREAQIIIESWRRHLYEGDLSRGVHSIGSSGMNLEVDQQARSARRSACVSRHIHLYPVEVSGLVPQSHSRLPDTL